MGLTAFVLGATGEVGKALVKQLCASREFEKVTLFSRRELGDEVKKEGKIDVKVINFDQLDQHSDAFGGFDVGFCTLGTTRGKAGKDGFFKVDHDYVVQSAKLAKDSGCKHFSLVSAQGANKASFFFYSKVKGQVEEEIQQMNFPVLSIFRPALLLCDRTESRPFEAALRFVTRPLDRWGIISVETDALAKAMVATAVNPNKEGVQIYENKDIFQMGNASK